MKHTIIILLLALFVGAGCTGCGEQTPSAAARPLVETLSGTTWNTTEAYALTPRKTVRSIVFSSISNGTVDAFLMSLADGGGTQQQLLHFTMQDGSCIVSMNGTMQSTPVTLESGMLTITLDGAAVLFSQS